MNDDGPRVGLDGCELDEPEDATLPLLRSVGGAIDRLDSVGPRLQRLGGGGGPSTVDLGRDRLVLGRGLGADVCIDDASLSRAHLRFERRGPEVVVTDLDSRNGLFVNGLRVHSAVLRDRDTLQAGELIWRFRTHGP